jgi:hypothetical protein
MKPNKQGMMSRLVRYAVSPGVFWALFVILAFSSQGCQQATTRAGGPAQVFLDPTFAERKIESLAYIGIYSGVMDDQAKIIMNSYLSPVLGSGQSRFFINDENHAARLARQAGKADVFKRVSEVWMDHHKVDPKQAQELCDALNVDGLLLAGLTSWERVKADWKSEQASFTRIGMSLSIIDADDGRRVWEAHEDLRKEPGGQAVFSEGFGTEAAESVAPHAGAVTPDPLRYEVVAEEIVNILVASLGSIPR